MKTVYTVEEIRDYVHSVRAEGKTIAFVPTMGNLHSGHISLVTRAQELADGMHRIRPSVSRPAPLL